MTNPEGLLGGPADRDLMARSSVLIVDDEAENLKAFRRLLSGVGCREVLTSDEPVKVAQMVVDEDPDLLIVDLVMPRMDGFAVMKAVREATQARPFLPILVMTGDLGRETRNRALSSGATDFLTKPFDLQEAVLRIRNLLHTRHLHARLAEQNETLEERVRERTSDLERARGEILQRLARAAEFRDDVTGRHAQRVGALASALALRMGGDVDFARLVREAAPLHDIGKIAIPDAILLKDGRLTPAEFDVMKSHTVVGGKILAGSRFPILRLARTIALTHHERWDGGGYPYGLKGTLIPLVGRLVAVADVFDSLTHERPYKRAFAREEAAALIEEGKGTQFDPEIVEGFAVLLEDGTIDSAAHAVEEPPEGSNAA